MTQFILEILLWLFVINLGIAFGAGLYETRMIIPQWFHKSNASEIQVNSQVMRQTDPGLKFWVYVTTGPLTLLTLANLIVALISKAPRHDWWLAAALISLAERIGTFTFFIPTAIQLMHAESLAVTKASKMASRWMRLNYIRSLLNLIGWLAALKALSLPPY